MVCSVVCLNTFHAFCLNTFQYSSSACTVVCLNTFNDLSFVLCLKFNYLSLMVLFFGWFCSLFNV